MKTRRQNHFPAGVAARLALLFTLMLMAAGCTSIYHRTRSELPPDPVAKVQRRLAEARQAGDQAGQAAKKLQEHLRQGKSDIIISADFDRLEAAGFELERQTLAVRDVVEPPGDNAEASAEMERLRDRAEAWLAYVQANRPADRTTQIDQLQELLSSPVDGRGRTR